MQTLRQNQTKVAYALFSSLTDAVDASGNKTGEKVKTYATPVEMYAYISAESGTDTQRPFGLATAYTQTMITDNLSCPVTESTILWIGATPNTDRTNYTHIVKRVSKGLNHIAYTIQEVSVQ